ncbi:MAG: glycosyltransferase family A protein [bacterium]|nr:glycosyltransferase family A protein [bacterium]
MTIAQDASEYSPLVTTVMIFLNGEKYIAEAIDSIVAQTYDRWELILVDDGSTDGATAIAQAYSRRHPDKIRYIDHPGHENLGMSASRNAGVKRSRGEFITFLDADDIWLPERLARFVAVAGDHPEAGMIYGPTLYWYSWADAQDDVESDDRPEDFPGYLDLPPDILIPPPLAMRQYLVTNGGCLPGICSLLINRKAFDAVGGFEESFRGLYEDQVFLSKMALNHPVVVIEDILDHYRQHSESCCHKGLETGEYDPDYYHPARGIYIEWLSRYLDQIGETDRIIRRAVRVQGRPYRWPRITKLINQVRYVKLKVRHAIRRAVPQPVARIIKKLLQWQRDVRRARRIRHALR